MHLLCKKGMDWHEWYVISASADPAPLQTQASAMNVQEYEKELADWEASRPTAYSRPKHPDKVEAQYHTYYVREVPDWPAMENAP